MVARRRPSTSPGYLIVGEDSYLRTRSRDEIIREHVPEEGREFAVARFSLDRTSLEDVLCQAGMRPMLSPRQVLVVSDADALKEESLPQLEEYFSSPADFTVLIFEAAALDGRRRSTKLLVNNLQVIEADSPADGEAVRGVERFARELGLQLASETAEELVLLLGTDQGRLRMEMEKLRTYVGKSGRVSSADLSAVVSAARRFQVFDLVDLLAANQRAEALALLRQLLAAGESPIGIVGLLAWLYRQLLQARSLPRTTPVWRAARVLRAPRSRVESLLRQAHRFSPAQLRAAFAVLLEADVTLKSSAANPEAILETTLVRLIPGRDRATA